MTIAWKDTSSYSYTTPKDQRVVTAVEAVIGDCRLVVHRLHGVKDVWFWSCSNLGMNSRSTIAADLEEAKRIALEALRDNLRQRIARDTEAIELLTQGDEP